MNPILQLKASRLQHNKNSKLGDYLLLRGATESVVGQLLKRIDGVLYVHLIEADIRIRINPVSLRRMSSTDEYAVLSVERMPDAMREHLSECDDATRVAVARKWFDFSIDFARTLHEIL